MSYGRNPHYIWSDGDYLNFGMIEVPEEIVNAFLYKILLTGRRDELKERLQQGKQVWLKPTHFNKNMELVEVPENDPEVQYIKQWLDSQEDEIVKQLMGV